MIWSCPREYWSWNLLGPWWKSSFHQTVKSKKTLVSSGDAPSLPLPLSIYIYKSNASNTLFCALSLALTLLLGKIIVCPTTICGFHFQSAGPTLISPNKKVSTRESAQKRVLLAFLIYIIDIDKIYCIPRGNMHYWAYKGKIFIA